MSTFLSAIQSSQQDPNPKIAAILAHQANPGYFCAMKFSIRWLLFGVPFLFSCSDHKEAEAPKETISRNSPAFNASLQPVLAGYYSLTDAFVQWDSTSARRKADSLSSLLGRVQIDSIDATGRDSASAALKRGQNELMAMSRTQRIDEMRQHLNQFSRHFFNFLTAVRYDESPLFLQDCPMAFHDQDTGLWLSPRDTIVNPYMGLHHPHYGKGMLECGENKAKLDFTANRLPKTPNPTSGNDTTHAPHP